MLAVRYWRCVVAMWMLTNTYSICIQTLCMLGSLTGCSQTYEQVSDNLLFSIFARTLFNWKKT